LVGLLCGNGVGNGLDCRIAVLGNSQHLVTTIEMIRGPEASSS
jgi:hypothetical protein